MNSCGLHHSNDALPRPRWNWTFWVLTAAAIYNLVWGAVVVLFPAGLFNLLGVPAPSNVALAIWQCVGMIVGVYGIGYALAARDPLRHWPIVLVGLLGKVFGPIGFLSAAVAGTFPWSFGAVIVFNDLIWWIPFGVILYQAFRYHSSPLKREPIGGESRPPNEDDLQRRLRTTLTHRGVSLGRLSADRPLMLVFLRHSGCTFCREAISDVAEQRDEIERLGLRLAVVHMGTPLEGTTLLRRYGVEDIHRVSDPQCRLYRAFQLPRGRLLQLLGPKVWLRSFGNGVLIEHGLGPLRGDGFQMPGVFILYKGQVVATHAADSAADRLPYAELARSFIDGVLHPEAVA